jgi:isoleucyl-tRNA synthetase
MHASWGNTIDAEDAFARMGADVMRWQFCAQPPNQNLKFGFGPGQEIKRKLLTLWNSVKVLVLYAEPAGFRPRLKDLEAGPDADLQVLDRWLVARTQELVRDATQAYEDTLTVNVVRAFEAFVEDVSNWYIRRSRRRFWDGDEAALRTLWFALVSAVRVIGPVMPFLAEELWQRLVRPAEGAVPSVFLAGWPEVGEPDEALLAEIGEVRRVVELGRQARSTSGLKLRQPLRRLVVQGATFDDHSEELRDELRVKHVEFGPVEATELRVRPNLPVLGPKLGAALAEVRRALQEGRFEQLPGGGVSVAGHELGADEVLVETVGREGWAVASEDGITVAVETAVDSELELEGRAYDVIHELNTLRRDRGFELTDRIRVTLPRAYEEVVERHGDWIAREVLAVELVTGDVTEPELEKAAA